MLARAVSRAEKMPGIDGLEAAAERERPAVLGATTSAASVSTAGGVAASSSTEDRFFSLSAITDDLPSSVPPSTLCSIGSALIQGTAAHRTALSSLEGQ